MASHAALIQLQLQSPSPLKRQVILKATVLMLFLLPSLMALAMDNSRLWLPATYKMLMPKLAKTAAHAEKTNRCKLIVNGRMVVQKNTVENYYFVVTCRDEQQTTYNLSYLYPVDGNNPELILEQGRRNWTKTKIDAASFGVDKVPVVDAVLALTLCKDALPLEAESLGHVNIINGEIKAIEREAGFEYQIPFDVRSALGSWVRYRAQCSVSADAMVKMPVFLESAGALALCRDGLKEETLSLRHVVVAKDPVLESSNGNSEFNFTLSFSAKSRRGSPINYFAACLVDASGNSEIEVALEKSGALTLCKDALSAEAIELKGLQVIDNEISDLVDNDDGFYYQIPFNAIVLGGGKNKYIANCQVDAGGNADASFKIDQLAVVSICLDQVKAKTRTMLDVSLPEYASVSVIDNSEGYTSVIPFNTSSPMGKTLYFQAHCRVSSIGVGKVKITPRRN